jgi:deazaflavin-dependent oxidoreductase (nitroreductase family)
MLRRVDPTRRAGPVARGVAWLSASRAGRWLSRHILWKLDPIVLRLSRGRLGMSLMIPTALLETRGARTGSVRRNAVIYFHDADDVIIAASRLGDTRNPAWFYNLSAHPEVTFGGLPMRATVVTDEADRARLWRLADNVFPPFATYRRDAARGGRTIPIVRLESRR